jgi:predicted RNA-binding protein YlqC (UPF0109 family)
MPRSIVPATIVFICRFTTWQSRRRTGTFSGSNSIRRGSILEVRVNPSDLGKVIGRNGRTATAFRTVVSALAGRGGARIDFVDVDRRR